LTAAVQKASESEKASRSALDQYEELRKQIGTRADQEYETVKSEIAAQTKKINDEVAGLTTQINDQVAKAQAAGATSTELETAKATLQQIAASYLGEPNKTFISSLDRMKDLLQNQAMLTTALATNYIAVKRGLEAANGV